jgi:HK97 family phage major capsid protein
MPKRREARDRHARAELERALMGGNRHERRAAEQAMARMSRAGISPFETRAMSRVDGAGGYLIPPLWLVDQLIPYLRADRTFADLWRGLELPPGTDNINIPRLKQGTATGPQSADGAPVNGRDMQDDFVTAKVQTVSGQVDVALQLLEQTPLPNFDEILAEDLGSDMNLQLSGQCYVGTGIGGQINGVWPGGAIANTNGIYVGNTNNTAAQTWVNGGGGSFTVNGSVFQSGGQLLSVIARTRLRPATAHVWHPWVWYYLLTQVDQQGRPLVVPGTPDNIGFNQAAVDSDGPAALDPNMPITFPASGGTNPQIITISNGQFAAAPGSGLFTPMLSGVWNDLFLWEGEVRTRALDQVLSGNLQMRFQMYKYVASIVNRFQAYAAVATGGATVAAANTSVSYATLTQFSATPANSVLNMTQQGF